MIDETKYAITDEEVMRAWSCIFDALRRRYFNSITRNPTVTIDFSARQPNPKAYGMVYNGGIVKVPIYVCLDDDEEVVMECMHILCHMYVEQKGIKALSRNQSYHNSKFRGIIECKDIVAEYDEQYGWNKGSAKKPLVELYEKRLSKYIAIVREYVTERTQAATHAEPEVVVPHQRKYVCPRCGNSVRATKDLVVLCGDCLETMYLEYNGSTNPPQEAKPLSVTLGSVVATDEEMKALRSYGLVRDILSRDNVSDFMTRYVRGDVGPKAKLAEAIRNMSAESADVLLRKLANEK